MASIENFWTPHTLLKTELGSHDSKTVKTEWDACFDWYFEAFKCYQEPKTTSLQNANYKLTEANKQLKKEKRFLRSLFHPPTFFDPTSRALNPLSFCTTPTSSTLCFHILILLPHFPLSLSPFPPLLSLSECAPLTLLRIQINSKYLMFPGRRPNCKPQSKRFLK